MRWEPLLLIILMAGLSGLLIVATGGKHRWFALLVLSYLTGLAAILFTPISFDGTGIYILHHADWHRAGQSDQPRRLQPRFLGKYHLNDSTGAPVEMGAPKAILPRRQLLRALRWQQC